MNKKFYRLIRIGLQGSLILALAACSGSHMPLNSSPPLPSLPKSWLSTDSGAANKLEKPSAATDSAVAAVFKAHTEMLSEVESAATQKNTASNAHPADWTPWHLDGMIANFAVDVGGVFGISMLGGASQVQATWQKVKPKSKAVSVATKLKPGHLKISGSMSNEDVSLALEPVVNAGLATQVIKNETNFRRNLMANATQFREICRALEVIVPLPGWHADSLQLQLVFNGQGQVSPLVAAGATVTIVLNWSFAQANPAGPVSPEILNSKMYKSLVSLIQTVSSIVPAVDSETAAIQASGLKLDTLQLGIEVSADGDIGLAQAGAEVQGRINFNKNSTGFNLQSLNPDLILLTPANQVAFINKQAAKYDVVQIPVDRFKQGLKKAIEMGHYFVTKSKSAETPTWKLSQLQTEFDATISGAFRLATMGVQGQVVLVFDRVE